MSFSMKADISNLGQRKKKIAERRPTTGSIGKNNNGSHPTGLTPTKVKREEENKF